MIDLTKDDSSPGRQHISILKNTNTSDEEKKPSLSSDPLTPPQNPTSHHSPGQHPPPRSSHLTPDQHPPPPSAISQFLKVLEPVTLHLSSAPAPNTSPATQLASPQQLTAPSPADVGAPQHLTPQHSTSPSPFADIDALRHLPSCSTSASQTSPSQHPPPDQEQR